MAVAVSVAAASLPRRGRGHRWARLSFGAAPPPGWRSLSSLSSGPSGRGGGYLVAFPNARDALSFHANRPWVLLSGEAVHSVPLSGKRGRFLTLRLERASWTLRASCSASRPPAPWAAPLGEQAWGRALFQVPGLPPGPRLWGSGAPGAVHPSLHSSVVGGQSCRRRAGRRRLAGRALPCAWLPVTPGGQAGATGTGGGGRW